MLHKGNVSLNYQVDTFFLSVSFSHSVGTEHFSSKDFSGMKQFNLHEEATLYQVL